MSDAENPYAAALADLRLKRAKIDSTIAVLEELSGLKLVSTSSGAVEFSPSAATVAIEETAGMFLGMSIVDAAKKLLALRKRTLGNVEIARELQAGGLAMNSKDPVNTIGSVLTRRFNEAGDVVKVGRGIWGLKEWYPGRSFKPTAKAAVLASDSLSEGDTDSKPDMLDLAELLGEGAVIDGGNF
jgi:HB1, ASXL, restriction endonuclease HTH domain